MDQRDDYSFCRDQLSYGEYILWTGRPEQGTLLSVVPFSSYLKCLGLSAFGLFMYKLCESTVKESERPILLLWLIFVAVGIYGFAIWPFQAQYLRKRTFYAITNKKIYQKRGNKITTLDAADITSCETDYHDNGKGTIRFPITRIIKWADNYAMPTHFTLENIPDMEPVLQAIARMDTVK